MDIYPDTIYTESFYCLSKYFNADKTHVNVKRASGMVVKYAIYIFYFVNKIVYVY